MKSRNTLSALSTALLAATLSACGGGGGGGAAPQTEPTTPRQQLTPLPAFLQAATTHCTFEEGGQQVTLTDYRGNLDNVTALSCSGVIFTDLNEIDLLTALQRLSLENSVLTGITELAGITTLKELDLSGSPLANLDTIAALTGLTRLDLENTNLGDITLLNALTALQSLDLSGNGITDVSALNSLQNLTTLDLSGNHITNPAPLAALTGLQNLDLSGNDGLSCVDVNSLDTNLGGATQIAVPSACTSALFLTAGSAATQTIDNSLQADPFVRLVISDVTDLKDVALFLEGDDLRIDANTSNGKKQITFTNWFVDAAYQVAEFEIVGNGILGFNSLRDIVGLGLELTEGKDTYTGTNAKDIVYGLGENDIIAGGSGSDIIVGGRGNDILSGYQLTITGDTATLYGAGDDAIDTFIYNVGDGNDTLFEYEFRSQYSALLQFGPGITSTDFTLFRDGLNLKLQFDESNSITLANWFLTATYRIGQIQFDGEMAQDAASWVNSQPRKSLSKDVAGTDESENLLGSTLEDFIYGEKGTDIIEGGKGDDILSGYKLTINGDTATGYGAGDDAIDTYIYNQDDGNDTIYEHEYYLSNRGLLQFGPGISVADITLYQEGDNLKLYFDDANSVTVDNWFLLPHYRLGQIQFDGEAAQDASIWVNSRPVTIKNPGVLKGSVETNILLGTTGIDFIYGEKGADFIEGGKGDDILSGYRLTINGDTVTGTFSGDEAIDTYIYNQGNGNDTIYESEPHYQYRALLQFGPGISAADIILQRDGNNLKLYFDDANSVTIADWFTSANYRLGQIQFNGEAAQDATTWVNSQPITLKNPGALQGSAETNILLGTTGIDFIYGDSGADFIEGGKGDDILSGYKLTINGDTATGYGNGDSTIDTYIYKQGDGNDTIYEYEPQLRYRALLQFGPGISAADITLYRDGNNLKLSFDNANSVTIADWYYSANSRPGQIQFNGEAAQDATTWVNSQPITLKNPGALQGSAETNILLGTSGIDFIYGDSGADFIEGGKGDDILSGYKLTINGDTATGYGNGDSTIDIYIYKQGDGNDTIYEYEPQLQYRALLQFGPGIAPVDVSASQSGSDLKLTLSSGGSVTVTGWFTNPANQLGQIQFDGEAAQDAATFVNSLLNP